MNNALLVSRSLLFLGPISGQWPRSLTVQQSQQSLTIDECKWSLTVYIRDLITRR